MKWLSLFLLVFCVSAHGVEFEGTAERGSKGYWGWDDYVATNVYKDVVIHVMFPPVAPDGSENCDTAIFVYDGGSGVSRMSWEIDGQEWNVGKVKPIMIKGKSMVALDLTQFALSELKDGNELVLKTNKKVILFSLNGSAWSFRMAYNNCMNALRSPDVQKSAPKQRTSPRPQTGSGWVQRNLMDDGDYSIDLLENGQVRALKYTGKIKSYSDSTVSVHIERYNPTIFVIESGGGDVTASINIGREIRANGIQTVINADCASACVNVFVGGVVRTGGDKARLGFHQASSDDADFSDGQEYVARKYSYYTEMGVDTDIVTFAASHKPDDMGWLNAKEAMLYNIVTKLANGSDSQSDETNEENLVRIYGTSQISYYDASSIYEENGIQRVTFIVTPDNHNNRVKGEVYDMYIQINSISCRKSRYVVIEGTWLNDGSVVHSFKNEKPFKLIDFNLSVDGGKRSAALCK